MPLTCYEDQFLAKLQKNFKIQIPKVVVWKNKLEPHEILGVYIRNVESGERDSFCIRLTKDFRFTIPKLVGETMKLKCGDVLRVTLKNA